MPTGRPCFKVDPAFNDSKPLLSIPARRRLEARGAWEAAGCWSCNKLTDGLVPVYALRALGVTQNLARLLIESTLWHPVHDGPAGASWTFGGASVTAVQFDQWEKWQTTKAQWLSRDPTAAERARNYRQRKKQREALGVTGVTSQPPDGDPANDDVLPSRRDTSHRREEKELSKKLSAVGSVPDTATFPDHCDEHRHDPDPPSCHDCRRTREQNTTAAEQHAAVEAVKAVDARLREQQRRADCWDCDDHGWRYGGDGLVMDPACRCTHPDVP